MFRIALSIFSVTYNFIIYLAYNTRFRQTAINVVCCGYGDMVVRKHRVGVTAEASDVATDTKNLNTTATPSD